MTDSDILKTIVSNIYVYISIYYIPYIVIIVINEYCIMQIT